MISQYPTFSKLTLDHQKDLTSFCSQFDPYSDFNFLSLFSWNIDGTTELSMLNDNLVIKLPDYLTGEPVLSILGRNKITESVTTLLEQNLNLKLVPHTVISNIQEPASFDIIEDAENHDYIYDLQDHATFPDGRYKSKRKNYNRFVREYGDRVLVRTADLHDPAKVDTLEHVFLQWAHERLKDKTEIENERIAIVRFLEHSSDFSYKCYEILIDDVIVGFSLNEVLPNKFANCHFQKCLLNFAHIDIFLTNYVAKKLLDEEGCMYINWEQDLGVEGLRQLKESYKPVKMLKKYQII